MICNANATSIKLKLDSLRSQLTGKRLQNIVTMRENDPQIFIFPYSNMFLPDTRK